MATGGEEVSLPYDLGEDFEVVVGSVENSEGLESLNGDANGLLDPAETFEMIHKEHSEAKRALEAQRSLLVSQIEVIQSAKEMQSRQLDNLASKVTQLELAVEERDAKILSLEADVQRYKEASEKSDELAAKLCNAEDTVKYYEQMTNQFRTDGFVEVNPHIYSDSVLASDLASKDKELGELKKLVDDLQSQLVSLEDVKKEKDEWKNLTFALENQLQCDSADLHDITAQFNEEKKALLEELERLKQTHPVATIPSSQPGGDTITPQHQCPECFYQATNEAELNSHILSSAHPSFD